MHDWAVDNKELIWICIPIVTALFTGYAVAKKDSNIKSLCARHQLLCDYLRLTRELNDNELFILTDICEQDGKQLSEILNDVQVLYF